MKVFIFGAGASKASQDATVPTGERAPLANEIFKDEYIGYATDLGLILENLNFYKDSVSNGGSLEKILTDEWIKIENYKQPSTAYADKTSFGRIAFYLWLLLQKVSSTYTANNLYAVFLRKLKAKDEPFGLISFNYDTLLDRAYRDVFGYTLSGTIGNYTKAKLIKPHGSVNWFLQKRGDDAEIGREQTSDSKVRFNIASAQMFNGVPLAMENMQVVDPSHNDLNGGNFISHGRFSGQYFYPLIFIPLLIKQYDFVGEFNDRVISEGKKLLSEASEIFLIGYKASDDIIKDLFEAVGTETKLNIISNSNPEAIEESILKWKPHLNVNFKSSDGFEVFARAYDTWQ